MRHAAAIVCILCLQVAAGEPPAVPPPGRDGVVSQILGRPTDQAIAMSLLAAVDLEVYAEYGTAERPFAQRTPATVVQGAVPAIIEIHGLAADTAYAYRLRLRHPGEVDHAVGPAGAFRTRRAPGSAFTFAVQGDSHPEREGKMFSRDLYVETLRLVARERPDFYFLLGDDFSIERLIERSLLNQTNVDRAYALQHGYLGIVGISSALFLVNGNHEQAGRHWLDGTPGNPAVLAGRARTAFFALPAPDGFYSGDAEAVEHVGQLRDYYAWTWGDALFVVIDPYWHTPIEVDHDGHSAKGGKGRGRGGRQDATPPAGAPAKRDLWQVTIGDAQYRWLHDTLLTSTARWKFVFTHHVMGTGRGGVEEARFYEWGGKDRNGGAPFASRRPGWDLPIHDLFVKAGVTILFQGHDHLFARQELDGVIYQSVPNPADDSYQAFNRDAYASGDILPNAGHLRIRVAADEVAVDYIRSFLPRDEDALQRHGMVAFTYTVAPRSRALHQPP